MNEAVMVYSVLDHYYAQGLIRYFSDIEAMLAQGHSLDLRLFKGRNLAKSIARAAAAASGGEAGK
jgi:hypothetical protein